MRIAPWLIAVSLFGGAGAAEPAKRPTQTVTSAYRPLTEAEIEKQLQIQARARELYPRRRDTPLRYLNITDNEVREIQRLVAGHAVKELVNISAVVTGCACEEGADCAEQVYILGKYKDRTIGLQLSRLRNRWSIGRVQRWWLDYAALQAREEQMEHREYEQAHGRLLLEFPMCPSGTTSGTQTANAAATPRSGPATASAAPATSGARK